MADKIYYHYQWLDADVDWKTGSIGSGPKKGISRPAARLAEKRGSYNLSQRHINSVSALCGAENENIPLKIMIVALFEFSLFKAWLSHIGVCEAMLLKMVGRKSDLS
jgi:hypothetical protein